MDARPIEVGIVPHTHWDREWYAPFQMFRYRLVGLFDQLLDMLERDASYARFLLDGQTAVLDDYLAIRPEAEERIRRLAASGRVSIGPWMILMDEYMVSGETIVRDLQMGIERGGAFGDVMEIGYLPDMFGHVAQMPQILRRAGFEHAVVWRGVPSAVDRSAFWWEAPDGSRVRAEYLWGSYLSGRDIPDDAKQLVARARGYERELGDARLPGGGILLMNGTDHQLPQPWLGRVVAEANDIQDEYDFAVTSLPEYVAKQPTDDLPEWQGELRSGARANVLMGVASNRVDIHQACAAAERALERTAEPLAALYMPLGYPAPFLREAWRLLVLNSAHDSACACSADDVVDAVAVRYQEARHIAEAVTKNALLLLTASVDAPAGGALVMNPTSRLRSGLVEWRVPAGGPVHFVDPSGTPVPTQIVGERETEAFAVRVTGSDVGWVLDMMRGPEFAGARIAHYNLTHEGDLVSVDLEGTSGPGVDLEGLREQLLDLAEGGATLRFRLLRAPERIAIATPTVEGFGWSAIALAEGEAAPTAVRADADSLANEHLTVTVDATTGTYQITNADGVTTDGLGRLVEGGDGGDTYNYSPPAVDRIIDTPDGVAEELLESGPVRARLRISSAYAWPAHAIGGAGSTTSRADETVEILVTTTLTLITGEPFLRVRTEFDNRCRDHRVRAHFPLPAPVTGSDAECAFTVVHRDLETEGGPHEAALPTFVSRRFVDATDGHAGLAILHDGLLEYEVVDGRELALTLLRATGYLSRAEPSLRPNPAGPLDPVEGPQLQHPLELNYALLPHRGDWRDADLYAAADAFLVDFERLPASTGGSRPAAGSELQIYGAEVSAMIHEGDSLVIRVFNPASEPTTVHLMIAGTPATGWTVNLRGTPIAEFVGETELRPGEILTLRLD